MDLGLEDGQEKEHPLELVLHLVREIYHGGFIAVEEVVLVWREAHCACGVSDIRRRLGRQSV